VASCPSWDVTGVSILPFVWPTVAADLAYFTRAYTDGGPVLALEARSLTDGSLRWSIFGFYDLDTGGGYFPGGVIVSDGTVFVSVRSGDPTLPAPERGVDAYA
jgi:hypothetical protein